MVSLRPSPSVVRPVAIASLVPLKKNKALAQPQQPRLLLASPPTAVAAIAAASSSSSGEPAPSKASSGGGFVADRVAGLKALATPFSDPVSNGRLVALCLAQMLCSVATLIHDT